jgi:hypothetical protein
MEIFSKPYDGVNQFLSGNELTSKLFQDFSNVPAPRTSAIFLKEAVKVIALFGIDAGKQ